MAVPIAIGCNMLAGCLSAHANLSAQTDKGPGEGVRVSLKEHGLPDDFFQPGADSNCANQIIQYRFVAWLNNEDVAVGFNTSPNCRPSPDTEVSGVLRVVVFDARGTLKASRNIPYPADGHGELVAAGEGMSGPNGTLLVRIESVNHNKEGRHESKSGVRLFDANLKDVAQLDGFMEQTTLVDHVIILQEGFISSGPRTYSVWDGQAAKEGEHWRVNWPAGAMDRKFGEKGFAFMSCRQEVRPSMNAVHVGAFHCALNVQSEDSEAWSSTLEDGRTAALIGLLGDGGVVGQVHAKKSGAEQLVMWRKGMQAEVLPWLPPLFEGTVDSAARDFSRYASFATNGGNGRLFVFDRKSPTPLVNRSFPKNGRAALAPDGAHYASFEANELRIYSLGGAN